MQVNTTEIAGITQRLENWRNVLLWWKRKKILPQINKHNEFYENFLRAIFNHSRAKFVVDASKSPIRLNYLLEVLSIEIHAIHIVRDPRAICWSKTKAYTRDVKNGIEKDLPSVPYWKTLKSIYMNMFLAKILKRKMPSDRFLRLRYEDIIDDTNHVLVQLESYLGVDFSETLAAIKSEAGLEQEHNVAGNRLRMKSNIKLIHDDSWITDAPFLQRTLTTIMSLPLLLMLGYEIFPKARIKNEK